MKKSILILFLLTSNLCFADNPKIVNLAKGEIGKGEIGKNNAGQYVKLYNRGLEAAWCAGFVSYILQQAGFTDLDYSLSAKTLYNQAKSKNRVVLQPQAGYIIIFWRDNPKSWKGHAGIVENVSKDYIFTIEANTGPYPSIIKRIKYKRDDVPKLLGYIKTD